MTQTSGRLIAGLAACALVITACGSDDDTVDPASDDTSDPAPDDTSAPAPDDSSAPAGDGDISVGKVGTVDELGDIADVCGDEPVRVALIDGIGTNSWSQTVKAEIESEAAKCPAITEVAFTAGLFDLAATTSAITSYAAEGYEIILAIPDAGPGEAHLPALRTATDAGSVVVNFASDPAGEAGVDYVDYVDWSPQFGGTVWAQWVVDHLGEEGGNVVFIGGPAGSAVSTQEFTGIQEVLADNPQINLLVDEPVVSNWDPAQAQEAMSGLLAQFGQIDALIVDYGAAANGVIRAYEAAGEPLPPMVTTDDNSLSCGFDELKAANPDYELATISSRTWSGRVALRKALAEYYGFSSDEPSIFLNGLFEDSTGSDGTVMPGDACLPDAPADATPSTQLSADELAALFG